MLVVDESMSMWLGADGERSQNGLPHITKIKRKPRGVGAEIKCSADAGSRVVLHLEIQKGVDFQRKRKYADVHNQGTALTLRLTEAYHGTGRIVCGDSAFSSVACALACRAVGLDYMGIVKSATTRFPRKHLLESQYANRGDQIVLQGEAEGVMLTALGWKDHTVQTLISTRGTTLPDERVSKRVEWVGPGVSDEVESRIAIPRMLKEYYGAANCVDVANQMRQGVLSVEENIRTKKWSFRIFSTILGMIASDAWWSWKYAQDEDNM